MYRSTPARTGTALVGVLAAVTLTAGCGVATEEPVTPEAKPVPVATLKTALLATTDLPAGFTVTPDDSSSPAAPITGDCAELANEADPAEFTESTKASLARETQTAFHGVSHQLASGATAGITAAVARLRDSIAKCKSFTQDLDGTKMEVTVTPETAPQLGDEAIAATLTRVVDGATLISRLVVVRQGNVVSALDVGGTTEDKALIDQAVQKATAKLQKL
jgi:hypothetical protein